MHDLRIFGRAEAQVDDLRAMIDGVLDGLRNPEGIAQAFAREGAHRHDPDVGRNQRDQPGDERAVTGDGRLRAGRTLHRIAIVIPKVPAVKVIDVTIVVVINVVARRLARVCPDMIADVRVIAINACVNHRDDDAGAGRARLQRY